MKYSTSFLFSLILVFMLFSCAKNKDEDHQIGFTKDEIHRLLDQAPTIEKKSYLLDSLTSLSSSIQEDHLRGNLLLSIAYQYWQLSEDSSFLRTNRQARRLLKSTGDTLALAAGLWDMGGFFADLAKNDSAYYYYDQAQRLYRLKNKEFLHARILLNMARAQKNMRNYLGSEKTTFEAIRVLEPLEKFNQLYDAYNNLGLLFLRQEDWNKALDYFTKAEGYLTLAGKENQRSFLMNNVGLIYLRSGNYDKASRVYTEIISFAPHFREKDPERYAMILDNYAFSRFLAGRTEMVLNDLMEAYEIRKANNFYDGLAISNLRLAKFFHQAGQESEAKSHAIKAKELTYRNRNFRDYMKTLKLLAALDPGNSLTYTNEYIKTSDSLYKAERAITNKFARIQFETDQYIAKNKELSQRIISLSAVVLLLLIVFVLLYVISIQRTRTKAARQQQKANEDVYKLTLAQQRKFEEGRAKEKQRISRDLHDGILGKLFGTQLSLESLNEEDDKEVKIKRSKYIDQIQIIAEEIRIISHQLQASGTPDIDFPILLGSLLEEQDSVIDFHLEMSNAIDWNSVSDTIKINLYRIVQEACVNIHKHSEATLAQIQIFKQSKNLILRITDNGKGFVSTNAKKGIGLKNMEARVKEMKGKIEIVSASAGTSIKVVIKGFTEQELVHYEKQKHPFTADR